MSGYEIQRDHKLEEVIACATSTPVVLTDAPVTCENCGCIPTYTIMVNIGRYHEIAAGSAHYRGCAACGWHSAVLVVVKTEKAV